MGWDCSTCRNLNIMNVFWIRQCRRKVASGRKVAGAIRSG